MNVQINATNLTCSQVGTRITCDYNNLTVNDTNLQQIKANMSADEIKDWAFQIKRAPHVLPNNRQEDEDDWLKSESNVRDNLKGQYPFKQMYKLPKLN